MFNEFIWCYLLWFVMGYLKDNRWMGEHINELTRLLSERTLCSGWVLLLLLISWMLVNLDKSNLVPYLDVLIGQRLYSILSGKYKLNPRKLVKRIVPWHFLKWRPSCFIYNRYDVSVYLNVALNFLCTDSVLCQF